MTFERSIYTVALVATAAYLAAGLHAYAIPPSDEADLGLHVLLALAAALLLVFPHLWTLIYLWGTGRAVRKEVEAHRASPRVISRARRLRLRAWPPLFLASAAALSTVILGQQALVGPRPWLHAAAFFSTLALQVWALWAGRRALWGNAELLDELDARARREATGSSPGAPGDPALTA